MSSKLKLSEFWPYQAAVLSDLVGQHTLSIIRNYDLNLSQWRVLAAIGDVPGCTSAQVVTVTPMDKGIVSRAVASLTERDLVTKTTDPDDKRRAALHLTKTGTVLYTDISETLSQAIAQIDRQNSPQFNQDLKNYIKNMQSLMAGPKGQ